MLSKLFGGRRPTTPDAGRVTVREVTSGFVQIDPPGLFAQYARSPNGRFLLAWRDASEDGKRGGARSSGEGRYLLIDGDRVLADGRMERPNDGQVADNGVFIFNDWLFSQELSGVFRAFRPDGSVILARRFAANLFNNGLAANGSLAVCQTANAPGEDGNKLTIFNLAAGTETASFAPQTGWASAYNFPPGAERIELEHRERGLFAYTLDGRFLEDERWTAAGLAEGDIYLIERLYRGAEEAPDAALAGRLIAGLDNGLKRTDLHPQDRARALKLKGECYETLGEPAAALAAYDAALAINPKVGVKRRADQLRKDHA